MHAGDTMHCTPCYKIDVKHRKKENIDFVKLQTHYHFKLDFQKVDQHTGGK